MSVMKVMSQRLGHEVLEWDIEQDEDSQRVDEARAKFDEIVNGQGFNAYHIVDPVEREVEVLKRDESGRIPFDPTVGELLLAAPLAGGR